ncbi:MAG: sulfotransferase [Bacteroidia bacterium]
MIVGAQKAGTTSLKEYLGEHPEITTHPQKEFAYFYDDDEYKMGYSFAFNKYFRYSSLQNKLIAKNAGLYVKEEAIARLKHHNPDCKIVLILRDPVERTFSSYNMEYNYGSISEPFSSIRNIIENNSEGEDDWKFEILVGMSIYINFVRNLYRYFPKKNIRILKFEDLKKNPETIVRDLFAWLNINTDFKPATSVIHNKTYSTKSPLYSKAIKTFTQKKSIIKKLALLVIPAGQHYKIGDYFRKFNYTNQEMPDIPADTELFLRAYFKPYNEELSQLTGIDFSEWNVKVKIAEYGV